MDENYTFAIVKEGKVDFFKKKLLGWSGPVGQVSTWAGNLRPVGHISLKDLKGGFLPPHCAT